MVVSKLFIYFWKKKNNTKIPKKTPNKKLPKKDEFLKITKKQPNKNKPRNTGTFAAFNEKKTIFQNYIKNHIR